MSFMRAALYYGPAIAIGSGIFIFSSISNPTVPDLGFSWQDKVYHSLAYFIFGLTLMRAFYNCKKIRDSALQVTVFFGIFYGITDEIHQAFVPGRNACIGDVAANALGVFLAAACVLLLKQKKPDIFNKIFQ